MFKSLATRNSNPIVSWQKELNRMFDEFNKDLDFKMPELEGFEPRVEVKEKDREYIVKAEIPGIPEKDLQVTLRDNCLILEGEKKNEEEKEDKGYYRSEFSYGSFYRAIPLEQEVDPEKVNATYKNGVLKVHVAKTGQQKHSEKNIPITLS